MSLSNLLRCKSAALSLLSEAWSEQSTLEKARNSCMPFLLSSFPSFPCFFLPYYFIYFGYFFVVSFFPSSFFLPFLFLCSPQLLLTNGHETSRSDNTCLLLTASSVIVTRVQAQQASSCTQTRHGVQTLWVGHLFRYVCLHSSSLPAACSRDHAERI